MSKARNLADTVKVNNAITVPIGTTAQRPAAAAAGSMFVNTDADLVNSFEFYNGSGWAKVSGFNPISATGGTITEITSNGIQYRVHTFTSTGSSTFTVTDAGTDGLVEYLIIGGGGGGGGANPSNAGGSGGGGAGGYRCSVVGETSGRGSSAESKVTVTPQAYTVVVGAGGSGGSGNSDGGNGSNSSVFGITALGGGGGGRKNVAGKTGGSGGGAGGLSTGGAGTANQGYDGGDGKTGDILNPAGGGGAGSAGGGTGADTSDQVRLGGAGLQSSINGTATYRGGGGGTKSAGTGGIGGGGDGNFQDGPAYAGTANTGGGGGGGVDNTGGGSNGGSGGSGIVIIRYPIAKV